VRFLRWVSRFFGGSCELLNIEKGTLLSKVLKPRENLVLLYGKIRGKSL
jgi:hypothetical protein